MKKFFKFCGMAVLVLGILGLVLWGTGVVTVGSKTMDEVLQNLTDGRIQMNMEGIQMKEELQVKIENVLDSNAIYHIEDANLFDKSHDIWKGNVEKTLLANGGIQEWYLELGGCAFELKDSDDDSYYVEYEGRGKSQAYVEGTKLYVKVLNGSDFSIGNNTERLILYVPMNVMVEELDAGLGAGQMLLDDLQVKKLVLDLGAGQVTAKKLQAEQLSVSVGAGEIILEEAQLKDVEVEVGAGNCEIAGTITGNVDAECAMGNLTFELRGKEADFNYDIQCVTGNISVGDKEYSGVAQEQSINNNAAKTMDVECAMGNVEILFE